jgi:hypothetical protein
VEHLLWQRGERQRAPGFAHRPHGPTARRAPARTPPRRGTC